jgi:chromosomal replication initiation ATPase DnaA
MGKLFVFIKTTFRIKLTKLGSNRSNQLNLPITHYTFKFQVNFFYEWLEEHYVKLLKVALTKELGKNAKLLYKIRMENTMVTNNRLRNNYQVPTEFL